MKIDQLIDMDKLTDHILNGYVSVRCHPDNPFLTILNYTHRAAHATRLAEVSGGCLMSAPLWGDGTIDYCRGLIYDRESGEIVSRPFKKFHNLNTPSIPETMLENLPKTTPTITEKMDGSLGIYYEHRGLRGIATRGSFESDQAKWATNWVLEHHIFESWTMNDGYTALFEIIYPENRIVVNYFGFKGLVLLSLVNKETGEEAPYEDVLKLGNLIGVNTTGRSTKDLAYLTNLSDVENTEGFVASYSQPGRDPVKVKIKLDEYCRLHRIMTGLNPKRIWESLRDSKPLLPEGDNSGLSKDFFEWLSKWCRKLQREYDTLRLTAYDSFIHRPANREAYEDDRRYRKATAEYFNSQPSELRPILWAMFDGKPIAPAIWKLIEPRGDDKAFNDESE